MPTRSSFTDGWLHTGDAARIDEDGFYYIVDRWKDMYISGGENVYPAEVESVLHQLAAVAEAAVIGVPSEQWGEVGMAIVAVKPGHCLAEEEIHAHCAANLARFKCPRLIRFVDALPRNATGKIHKPTLRKDFATPGAADGARPSPREDRHQFRSSFRGARSRTRNAFRVWCCAPSRNDGIQDVRPPSPMKDCSR